MTAARSAQQAQHRRLSWDGLKHSTNRPQTSQLLLYAGTTKAILL
jgi:hypothetical protein